MPEEEPITIPFGDMCLASSEGMPLNPCGREGLGVDEPRCLFGTGSGRPEPVWRLHPSEGHWLGAVRDGIEFTMLRLEHRKYAEGIPVSGLTDTLRKPAGWQPDRRGGNSQNFVKRLLPVSHFYLTLCHISSKSAESGGLH